MVTLSDITNRSNLKDDKIRYDYAVSIAEQDPDRYAFILLQLMTRRLREGPIHRADIRELSKRILEYQVSSIFPSNFERWTPTELKDNNPKFLRGFIEDITIDTNHFLEHADEIYKLSPIRHLSLKDYRKLLPQLAGSEHLKGIASLRLWGHKIKDEDKINDNDLATLATSEYLKDLAVLDISYNNITDEGLLQLARSKNFPNLQYVKFYGNQTTDYKTESVGYDMTGPVMEGHSLTELGQTLKDTNPNILWVNPLERLGTESPHPWDF